MEGIISTAIQSICLVLAAALPVWLQLKPMKSNLDMLMHHLQVDADRREWEIKLIEWRDWYIRDIAPEYRTAIVVSTSGAIDGMIWIVDHAGNFGEISDLEKILNYSDTAWDRAKILVQDHSQPDFAEIYFCERYDLIYRTFRNGIISLFKDFKNNKQLRFYESAQALLEQLCTHYNETIDQKEERSA
ncbi:MAG: hypothetical protein ACRCUT_07835 [Spirochaetota bacterium]